MKHKNSFNKYILVLHDYILMSGMQYIARKFSILNVIAQFISFCTLLIMSYLMK